MSRLPKVRSIGVIVAVAAALAARRSLPISRVREHRSALPLGTHARAAVGSDSWRLFKATNQSSGRFDVPKLRLNRELSVIARRHSMAMARSGELFHTGDVDVVPARHRMAHLGRERRVHTAGTWRAWSRRSWTVRPTAANILNRAFRQVAIGSVRVDGTLWVTVFFFG